jgi:hypothetical protein
VPKGVESSVARYRETYRGDEIGRNYRGWLHFAFTSSVCIAGVVICALGLEQPSPAEWLTVPVVFIYANLVEYLGHRGPMHHPVRGLGLLYRRHSKQHHRFFTDREMSFESSRDFKAVLFPPVMILFFIGAMGVPMWILTYFLASENVAWLAVATALAYYLNYEWLHFAYHCDPRSRIGRLPGIGVLRQLHLNHHNPKLMTMFRTHYRANGNDDSARVRNSGPSG